MAPSNRRKARPSIATKAPRVQPPAPTVLQLLHTRPWLTRPQSVSEQDLFLIHTRDNLVSGATGPKDWPTVTEEFNEAFKDELKRPLVWKTLSKRCGVARKTFLRENEDYARVLEYPVPEIEGEDGDEDMISGAEEQEGGEVGEEMEDVVEDTTTSTIGEQAMTRTSSSPAHTLPAHDISFLTPPPTHSTPGFYDPSSVSLHSISAFTRAKYHLQHRTNAPVAFEFLDPEEQDLITFDPQYVDAQIMASHSPLYARALQGNPNTTVIDVPVQFSVRTINIFIQLIAPARATKLPEHYLWKVDKAEPGVYDRFGGIETEEIVWSVDVLFDLIFFAQLLKVFWVVDMAIDRLHFLFTEQKRYEALFRGQAQQRRGSRLPVADTQLPRLSAEDFEEEVLDKLMKVPTDMQTLRFVVDMLGALGGGVHAEWLEKAPEHVRDIFAHANGHYLVGTTREQFCERYHHHSSEPCYTLHDSPSAAEIIEALYATSTVEELVHFSDGLLSTISLSTNLDFSNGDIKKLKEVNSSPEMLEAEKMVIEVESRLEETKAALRWAREAPEAEKQDAIAKARRVAQGMYSRSQL